MSLTEKPRDQNDPPSLVPLVRPGGPAKIGWRVDEWSTLTGTSKPTTYRRIKDKTLRVRKYGGLTLILGFADEPAAPAE
jgi:hypothetical protein